VTLAPGQSYAVRAAFIVPLTAPTGTWYAYETYQTSDGHWHDDPHDAYFTIL
jgi:hypothetical protein